MRLAYTSTDKSLKIYVGRGKKGERDFIVYVKTQNDAVPPFISSPEGRPRHIEWVDLYRDFYRFSRSQNPHFSEGVLAPLPPKLATSTYVRPIEAGVLPVPHAVYSVSYRSLLASAEQHVGRYKPAPLDFVVALLELLFVQEVSNYRAGVLHILLTKMLRDELLGTLPGNAARAGETPQSLQNAVTSLAVWKKGSATRQLFNKWRGFYGV